MKKAYSNIILVSIILLALFYLGCSFNNPFLPSELEPIGGDGADVDLSNYYTKPEVDFLLGFKVPFSNVANEDVSVDGTVEANKFIGDGSGLTNIPGTSDNDWTEDSGNIYRENGNVGVGTTNPNFRLDIAGTFSADSININGAYTFPVSDGSNGYILKTDGSGNLTWQQDNTGSGGDDLGNHTASQNIILGSFYLSGDGGNEGVFVASDGDIGIGTNSPGYRLDVNGTFSADSINVNDAYNMPTSDGTNSYVLKTDGSGNVTWQQDELGPGPDDMGDHTATENIVLGSYYLSGDGGDEGVFVEADGDTGIGTNAPGYKLDVAGTFSADSININGAYNFPTTDGSNGYVLKTDGSGSITWQADNAGSGGDDMGDHTATQNIVLGSYYLSGDGGDEGVFVEADGDTGIGTNTPGYKLDVAGTFSADSININSAYTLPTADGSNGYVLKTDGSGTVSWQQDTAGSGGDDMGDHTATQNVVLGSYYLSGDGGNEGIFVEADGDVGIGTNSPSSRLSVNGNLSVSGNIAVIGTVDGYDISAKGSNWDLAFTHISNTSNPHSVTSTQVGLGNVPNVNFQNSYAMNDGQRLGTDEVRARDGGGLYLRDDTGNLGLFIEDGGEVGVKTASPSYDLDVFGTFSADSVNINGAYTFPSSDGSNGYVLKTDGSGAVSWQQDNAGTGGDDMGDHAATQNVVLGSYYLSGDGGNEGVFVEADGDTGIGTNTPGYKLDVSGTFSADSININGAYTLPTADGSNGYVLKTDGSGSVSWQQDTAGSGGDDMGDHTATQNVVLGSYYLSGDGGNEGVFVDVSGNVGVGTNTPGSKLAVNGALSVNGNITVTGTVDGYDISAKGSNWDLAYTHISNTSNPHSVTKTQVSLGNVPNTNFLNSYAMNNGQILSTDEVRARDTGGLYLRDVTGNLGIFVENGGDVGVNTASPNFGLDVNDTFSANSINVNDAYTLPTADGSNGYVLKTNGSGTVTWQADNAGSGGDDMGDHTATQNVVLGSYYLSGDGGNEGVFVDSSGNVGIGTNIPGSKMDVNGDLNVSGNITLTGTVDGYDISSKGSNWDSAYTHISNTSNPHSVTKTQVSLGNVPNTNFLNSYSMNNGQILSTDEVRARDSGGLFLRDDTGTLGIFVEDGGQVGVGTSTPGYPLDINGNTNIAGNLTLSGTVDGYDISTKGSNWDSAYTHISNTSNPHSVTKTQVSLGNVPNTNFLNTFTMNNSQRLQTDEVRARDTGGLYLRDSSGNLGIFVENGGDVGVNTASPNFGLDVNDTFSANSININDAYTLPTADGSSGYVLKTNGSGTVTWQADNTGSGGDDMGDHTATQNIVLGSYYLSGDGGSEGVYVDSSGNVGIGTNLPGSKLAVNGSLSVNGNISITGTVDGYDLSAKGSNWDLAYTHISNTSNPHGVTKTQVGLSNVPNTNFLNSYSMNNGQIFSTDEVRARDTGGLYLRDTSGNLGIFVENGGDVGVNTASPGFDLDVNGTFSANSINVNSAYTLPTTDGSSGYILKTNGSGTVSWQAESGGSSVWSTSGSDIYYTTGDVGIGVSSPNVDLEVAGSIRLGGDQGGSAGTVTLTDYTANALSSGSGNQLRLYVPDPVISDVYVVKWLKIYIESSAYYIPLFQ